MNLSVDIPGLPVGFEYQGTWGPPTTGVWVVA